MAGSKCNACGAQYPQIKTKCPSCGALIAPAYPQVQASSKSGISPLLKATLIIAGLFFGLIFVFPMLLSLATWMLPTSNAEQQPATKPTPKKPITFDGNASISVRVEGGSQPVVIGQTSLPDGTALMVEITGLKNKYSAAHRPIVSGGKFTAGPFTYANGPLYADDYRIVVTMERPEIQPAELVPFLGAQGERLKGPLVVDREIAGYPKFKTVALEITAKIDNSEDDLKAHYGNWDYNTDADDLSGQKYKTAILQSKNSFNLEFPYAGEQHGTLMLRNHPKHGRDVVIAIQRGQILCHTYECDIGIAFDNKPARTIQGNEPASRDDTVVFLPNPKRLMGEMQDSREMRVQLILFNQPPVTLVFQTAGLDLKRL